MWGALVRRRRRRRWGDSRQKNSQYTISSKSIEGPARRGGRFVRWNRTNRPPRCGQDFYEIDSLCVHVLYGDVWKKNRLLVVGRWALCFVIFWSDSGIWMLRKCTSQATYLQQKVQNPNMWNWISVQCPLLILIFGALWWTDFSIMMKSKPPAITTPSRDIETFSSCFLRCRLMKHLSILI